MWAREGGEDGKDGGVDAEQRAMETGEGVAGCRQESAGVDAKGRTVGGGKESQC